MNKRIGKIVRRIKNLIPSLGSFDGSEPIALLKFLLALQEGFNTLRAPESTAVRTMAFLIRGDAKNFYESWSQSATKIKGGSNMSELTWPRMFYAFMARYLMDDHLRTANESVTRILQQPEEPEDGSNGRPVASPSHGIVASLLSNFSHPSSNASRFTMFIPEPVSKTALKGNIVCCVFPI